MKFSELWLREWVNPDISSKSLSNQITMAGLEVSGIKSIKLTCQGVIIGKVIQCYQHPDADKLCLATIDIGKSHLLNITCGAQNCHAGLKVAVATVGSTLWDGFKITATSRLCGELSEGMLCSFSEIGIPNERDGIIELPKSSPIGADICEHLKINDNIIEISVTPNRADCLSIIGIARDVSACNNMLFTEPEINPVSVTINTSIPVHIEDSEACPRYLCRVVKGINIKTASTPFWMREKLRRCGIDSIDSIVDITNYVLLELGQPLHVFDMQNIEGGIVVRMAEEGEKLKLIGGKEAELDSETLIIADHQKALMIAGISGSEYFGVNYQTQNILLACSFFNPNSITSYARRKGICSDISHRYECGVDPEIQYTAIERATRLLIDIFGGQAGPVIDITDQKTLPKRAIIKLHRKKLDKLLGYFISKRQVSDILHRLGFDVTEQGDIWLVIAPSWRFDIKIEEDLVEEVARIHGYNNIPNALVHADLVMNKHPKIDVTLKRVKTLLVDHDFQEVITYSFVDPKAQSLLHPGQKALILPNPISVDMSAMRLSLWPGLISAVIYNQNRQQTRVRLFESGMRFLPDSTENLGIKQDVMLAGVITGYTHNEHWALQNKPVDFYDLKGELESLLDLTGKLPDIQFHIAANPALHPGQSSAIYLHGECIGYIGVIHPKLERRLSLSGRTIVFELNWEKCASSAIPQAREIFRFPEIRRDIAVIVAENIAAADILEECKKVSVNQIARVNLFDVYHGKGITVGYKSLAISLILQNKTGTLEEDEIAATVAKCVEALRQRFRASLRD